MATSKRKQTKRKGPGGATRGRGRPVGPGGKMIIMQVKAPPALKREFTEWCTRHDISYSQVLRRAMRDIIRGIYVPVLAATEETDLSE